MSDHECVRCIRCDSCPVCAADALDREVEETDRLRLAIAEATRECQRLRDMIEIEREGQRSMAGALAEIRRLSDLNVTINRPALSRARETDGAVREAIEWLDLIGPSCELFHHKKADQHKGGTPCPIEARYRAWLSALSSPPRPETKDDDKGGAA